MKVKNEFWNEINQELHYHQAKYDDEDNLTRECKLCGEDLLSEFHIKGDLK